MNEAQKTLYYIAENIYCVRFSCRFLAIMVMYVYKVVFALLGLVARLGSTKSG